MSDRQTGVVVNHVFLGSSAQETIEEGDVILEIDGHPVADNGSVEFRPKERTNFT